MTRADTAAMRALLLTDAEIGATNKLFDGAALSGDGKPITETWFIVLQTGRDTDSQERHTGPHSTRRPQFTFQCAGTTPDQAQWATERLDGILRPGGVGVRLPIPGHVVDPLKRDLVSFVQRDTDVSPPMWFQTVEYTTRTQPNPNPA